MVVCVRKQAARLMALRSICKERVVSGADCICASGIMLSCAQLGCAEELLEGHGKCDTAASSMF